MLINFFLENLKKFRLLKLLEFFNWYEKITYFWLSKLWENVHAETIIEKKGFLLTVNVEKDFKFQEHHEVVYFNLDEMSWKVGI